MPTSLRAIAEKASTTGPVRKRTVLKSPVRENCTPGSVRGRSGNWPTYLDGRSMTRTIPTAFPLDLTPEEQAAGFRRMVLSLGDFVGAFPGESVEVAARRLSDFDVLLKTQATTRTGET